MRFQYRNFSLSTCQKVAKIQFLNALFKQEYEIDLKTDANHSKFESGTTTFLNGFQFLIGISYLPFCL